jgi:hypothetical protein
MSKGVVLSIKRKKAYVFTEECGVTKIAARPGMTLGQEISIEPVQENQLRSAYTFKPAWAALALVIVIALAVFLAGPLGLFSPVYATLSIDVNPSIEMDLDRSLSVLAVRAMNQDAARLLEGLELENLDWEEAVFQWAEKIEAEFKDQEKTMLLSAVLPDNATQFSLQLMAMENELQQSVLTRAQIHVVYTHDEAVSKIAQQNGLSVGRQMLLNQSEAKNQGWDPERIEAASLGELIRTLLHGEDHDQTGLTTAGHARTLSETIHSALSREETSHQHETNRVTDPSQSASGSTWHSTIRETSHATDQTQSNQTTGATQQVTTQKESDEPTHASGTTNHSSTTTTTDSSGQETTGTNHPGTTAANGQD